jgi:hypothetical protein
MMGQGSVGVGQSYDIIRIVMFAIGSVMCALLGDMHPRVAVASFHNWA